MRAVPASYTNATGERDTKSEHRFRSLTAYRFALWTLIQKDFKVRYRNMSLGILWSVINPLVMLGVLLIVFTFIHPNHHVVFFPVFMLIGLVVFNFTALCLPASTTSVIDNAPLVKKVIFPRELVPLAAVFSQLAHMGIQLLILFAFLFVFRVPVSWTWLWMFPCLLVLLVFLLGAAFALSALHVYYRDMLYLVDSLLKVFFWLTPIFYDLKQVALNLPRPLYYIYLLNPMAGCIDGLRSALLMGQQPDMEALGVAALVSFVMLISGWWIYQGRMHLFADEL